MGQWGYGSNKSPSLGDTIDKFELKVECSFNELFVLVIRMLALHFIYYSSSIELSWMIYKVATRLVTKMGILSLNYSRQGAIDWLSFDLYISQQWKSFVFC